MTVIQRLLLVLVISVLITPSGLKANQQLEAPTCPVLLKQCAQVVQNQQKALVDLKEAADAREEVVVEQKKQLEDIKQKLAEERKSSIWKILGTILLVALI